VVHLAGGAIGHDARGDRSSITVRASDDPAYETATMEFVVMAQ
jgi:hypothetical protein